MQFYKVLMIFICLFVGGYAFAEEKERKYNDGRGEVVWEVPTDQKVIALTFDDGPNPKYTPEIMSLLEEYKAKATFFVVGERAKKYPDIILNLSKKGHEIGNHTNTHPQIRKYTVTELEQEISAAQQEIEKITGVRPTLFRPPGGYCSETVIQAAREKNCLVVLWTWGKDTRDWSRPGAKKIVQAVLSKLKNGNIILLHDHGGNRQQTVNALKTLLPQLQQNGYKLVTVSELLEMHGKAMLEEMP